jgi:ABC-type polysaccharide/polyol phosphate transport system ATPase subunit
LLKTLSKNTIKTEYNEHPPAIELISVGKWEGSVAHIQKRFVRNESLQSLIELILAMRHVEDHRKGAVRDKPLEALLRNFSLTIARGSVVGVVDIGGRSRDALIRILGNSEFPSAGAIRLYGSLAAFGQLGVADTPYKDCRQLIERGARLVGIPRPDINQAMARVPEFSGLGEQLDLPLRRVSRSVIADLGLSFLCCLDYDILIADEISRPRSKRVMAGWQSYLEAAPKRNKTVVVTSGDTGKLEGVCTHLLLIKEAGLFAYGPALEIEAEHADFLVEARTAPRMQETHFESDEEDDEEF